MAFMHSSPRRLIILAFAIISFIIIFTLIYFQSHQTVSPVGLSYSKLLADGTLRENTTQNLIHQTTVHWAEIYAAPIPKQTNTPSTETFTTGHTPNTATTTQSHIPNTATTTQSNTPNTATTTQSHAPNKESAKQADAAVPIVSITVVTAYWNIGVVANKIPEQSKDPKRYSRYMESYAYIENPVVAYFDDPIMQRKFEHIRNQAGFPTKTILFQNRTELWGFSLEPRIKEILSRPGYPSQFPGFHSTYQCAMHAKYDAIQHAIVNNYFNTKYFLWCDLGIFRDMPKGLGSHYNFRMTLPPKFDTKKIAFTQVFPRNNGLSLNQIFLELNNWLAGGFFIGTADLLLKLAEDYRNSTEKYIRMNLAATDQQVLYAMYQQYNKDEPRVQIQVYVEDGSTDHFWMFLGELLRNNWWKINPIPDDCHECNRTQLIDFF